MPEQKYKKAVFVCRIVAVLSLVTVLIIMVVAASIENWNDTISTELKIISQVSWVCFLVSLFGIATLRQKSKEQKTDAKIKELEQEIERLKKK